ncbi:MAG: dihydroorotase family protein [Patescibacteria group bacterium]
MLTLPGLIDLHVHLRDPGQTQKEDFYTGTCAALAGGFTTILDMPNNKAPITTSERLDEKIKIAKEKIACDVGFYFGSMGDNLDEFEKVKDKVMGLKLYLNQTTGSFLVNKDVLEKTFLAWKNLNNLTMEQSSNETITKPILVHAEEKKVEDVINLVKKTKIPTHFCHISLASELKMILKAKKENLPVTCGVTPHHLFLTTHDAKIFRPFGQMKPPLSSKKDQDYLWENLNSIDVIESDHAPHTIEEKQSDNPPYGVPGLETTLPILLTAVSEKRLTMYDIIRLCHKNPAKILNIKTGPETKIEVDIHKSYIINPKSFFTKCGWSPFDGWKVKGKVQRVFIRGKKVFEDGKVLVKPGSGKVITEA